MFYKTVKYMMFLLLSVMLVLPGMNVFGEEWLPEKDEWVPDVSLSTTFLTKYIWRGQNLGNEPVMQVDGSLSKDGFTFDIWGNYSLAKDKTVDSGRYQEFTELDYTASYEFNVGDALEKMNMGDSEIFDPLSITTGYTFYTFPNLDLKADGSYSHETALGVSYNVLLQPFFTWYWDVEAGHGSYLQFGGGHTFDLGNGIEASLGTSLAYNYEQWTTQHGWSDMLITADVSIPVLEYFTVTPQVAYSVILDRDTYSDAQSNEFYGGISVGFAY
ncbi:MAG: hypothetical protein P9L90_03915 [Candidatus Aadella gelida]|nr:hypothetical protein [Candidatus Aadella gelida]